MSAIKKGKINWANVKTGKKQQRENDGTGFSLHVEATVWNGKQTGAPPSESSAFPPKDLPAPARAQTRGGQAQGEVLREAIQNLEGLCAYWGWELEDPDLIT